MPEIIKRSKLGLFTIWTKEEADKLDMVYKIWYEAKTGEYALSDDGFVSIVRSMTGYKDNNGTAFELKLPYGTFWIRKNTDGTPRLSTKCLYLERKATRSYGFSKAMTWGQKYVTTRKTKRMIRIAAKMLVENGEINYERLGMLFFPTDKIPTLTVKKILKHKEVKEYMEDQVEVSLARYGITDEYIVNCYKDAVDIARNNQDGELLLKSGVELAKLKGMYPVKKTVTNQIEFSKSTQYLDAMIDSEDAKISQIIVEKSNDTEERV